MTSLEKLLKEFKKGCNANNISDPPNDTEWIEQFIAHAFAAGRQEINEKIIEIITAKKIHHKIDMELYEDSGGGEMCEICGKQGYLDRKEECEPNETNQILSEILSNLESLKEK